MSKTTESAMEKMSWRTDRDMRNGVEKFWVETAGNTPAFLSSGMNGGWRSSPVVIRVRGEFFLAAAVLGNALGDGEWVSSRVRELGGLRYGPGGRRHYVRLTEAVAEEIFAESGRTWSYRKTSERELARQAELAEFALLLVDLLSGKVA